MQSIDQHRCNTKLDGDNGVNACATVCIGRSNISTESMLTVQTCPIKPQFITEGFTEVRSRGTDPLPETSSVLQLTVAVIPRSLKDRPHH